MSDSWNPKGQQQNQKNKCVICGKTTSHAICGKCEKLQDSKQTDIYGNHSGTVSEKSLTGVNLKYAEEFRQMMQTHIEMMQTHNNKSMEVEGQKPAERQIAEGNGNKEKLSEDQAQAATLVSKSKRKRGKNRSKQGLDKTTGQNYDEKSDMKGEHSRNDLKVSSVFERKDADSLQEDSKSRSGDNFGKELGMFDHTTHKLKPEGFSGAKGAGSDIEVNNTRLKFKDFYSDSEDEDKTGKVMEVPKSDQSSASASTSEASLNDALSGLHIQESESKKVLTEKKVAEIGSGSSKLSKCSYCAMEGNMLDCSRCHLSSYCNKQCQRKDYPKHKALCKRKEKFDLFRFKIPETIKLSSLLTSGSFTVSPYLDDLSNEWEYQLGRKSIVMAEIVGPYFHLFRYGIVIRDLAGKEKHILFYNESLLYNHATSEGRTQPYLLGACLEPGNFIVLLDTHQHLFLDGTVGIRINHLEQVHFIFKN